MRQNNTTQNNPPVPRTRQPGKPMPKRPKNYEYIPRPKADNVTIVLCNIVYIIPFFGVFALLLDRKNKVLRFHANQAILFNIAMVLILLIAYLINTLVIADIYQYPFIDYVSLEPEGYNIQGYINFAGALIIAFLFLSALFNANRGLVKPLPMPGSKRIKFIKSK